MTSREELDRRAWDANRAALRAWNSAHWEEDFSPSAERHLLEANDLIQATVERLRAKQRARVAS